jgi:hypothetical protein
MKRITIFKALATIAAMLCLTTFTSCENEEITINSPKYIRAVENYSVTLSEDFFYLYDVVATISNSETGDETIKLDSRIWNYSKNWDGAIPGKFTCDVIATVKNPLPEIDPEKVYKFQTKSSSSLQLFDETGYMNLPVWDNGSKDIDHTMPMGGVDNVTKYVTVKNSEVVILKSSYTINN